MPMTHWITGLGVGLVYMNMRSANLNARIRAAVESTDPKASTTEVNSASIRAAREHIGTVEFSSHMPADTVDLLRKAHLEQRQYQREFNARRT
eukprot:scaffold15944_cov115-Isochrysis_galbana.AAC.11